MARRRWLSGTIGRAGVGNRFDESDIDLRMETAASLEIPNGCAISTIH
jgi:hypothetical protein